MKKYKKIKPCLIIILLIDIYNKKHYKNSVIKDITIIKVEIRKILDGICIDLLKTYSSEYIKSINENIRNNKLLTNYYIVKNYRINKTTLELDIEYICKGSNRRKTLCLAEGGIG